MNDPSMQGMQHKQDRQDTDRQDGQFSRRGGGGFTS